MKRVVLGLLAVAMLTPWVSAQNARNTIYAEAVHKGPTRVTEDKFQVQMTAEDATYRQTIRDAAGNEHFELTIAPWGPAGDTKITSWQVTLRDLRHSHYGNLLRFEEEPSEDPKDNLWWLNPIPPFPVPIHTRRIIKVEAFYVMFQVRDFHFTPVDSPYLDSMTVQFEFSNSDPRNLTR